MLKTLIIGETPGVLSEHSMGRRDFGLFPPKAPVSAVIITRNEAKDIYFLRLFRRSLGNFNTARVHERIELNGTVGKFSHPLKHYSYDTIAHWIAKMDRYTTLSAQEALKRGKKKTVLQLAFALPYYFLRYYLLEGNFLNGLEGFYWSVFNSYYHFTKYTKIKEGYAPITSLTIS